ncbi:MAG TPA: PAS domain S-box protein [Terriglobales bacterium]|nr:PAS domain S-box protein [Terriglobales bacterium]
MSDQSSRSEARPSASSAGADKPALAAANEPGGDALTRLQQALRESEQRHRLVTEAMPVMIWMSGTDKLCYYFNKSWLDFVGRTLEQEQGNGWAENVHPDDFDRCLQTYVAAFDARRSFQMEYRLRHHSGEYRWIYDHGVPRYAADGTFEGYLGGCLDIHAQKTAEEALRASENQYRDFAESASIAMHWVGPDGAILWANQAELDLLGYTREEYLGRNIAEFHVDEPVIGDILDRLGRGERLKNYEARLRAKDGSIRHVAIDSSALFEDGKFVHTRCFTRDITAARERDKAGARLAAIVNSSDDAIVSKDLRGIVTSWNPAAERMFGYTAAEMIGRPILTLIPPELYGDEDRILATIARGERIEHFETVRLRKDGQRIEVSLTVSPVKDESGRIEGAAKIARDITERRRAEKAVRTSERLASVGRLAATIAHEINNPLEAITNLIYLAKNAAVRDDVRQYLTIAEEELERVAHMTRQTLGFYRDTRGLGPVRVGAVVLSLLPVFASRLRNKGIALHPEISDDVEIEAVAGELRQLVANLLGNSIDAARDRGRITIRVSAAREWSGAQRTGVRLTVADNGSGIPLAARGRLFEPFFTTKQDVGTGLGLWVCKAIVEKHRGSIRVRTRTAPGRSGTAFSIFLPTQAQPAVREELLQEAV